MKQYFIFILASIFTLLFASCSQDNESTLAQFEKSNLVSVSTQLPAEFAQTRAALPTTNGYQLRCILEVWSKGDNPALLARHEKLAATGDEKISFTFEVEQGTYDCRMWADFVTTGAIATEKGTTVKYQGYEDKFYNTADLTAIVIKDVNALFNTEACDAFYATKELVKGATSTALDATLSRPFAKLTIKEKEADSHAKCSTMAVSYAVPTTFNLTNGAISGTATATYTGAPAGSPVYFTHYILADDETLSNISLSFTGDEIGAIEKTIPSGVPTKRNHRTNASGYFIGQKPSNDKEATVNITVGNDWLDDNGDNPVEPETPQRNPEVGDFYYQDGTYAATYTASDSNPCIGIVFAVGAQAGDEAANYDNKLSDIKGYVLAAKDAAGEGRWSDVALTAAIEGTSSSETDYLGYKNSIAIKGALGENEYKAKYPAAYACTSFAELTAPANTSGWYLPSVKQLDDIAKLYYTAANGETPAADGILKTNLKQLGTVEALMQNNGEDGYYWSSTVATSFKVFRIQFYTENTTAPYRKKTGTSAATADTYTRAVLTF